MTISRRELLRRAGLLVAASSLPTFTACSTQPEADGGESDTGTGTETETGDPDDGLPEYVWEGEPGPETMFTHGIASGDPLADSIILWTRVSPDEDGPVESFFELALDPDFEERVAADWIPATDGERDHTIKIDVSGLEPATSYYYRFYAQGRVSAIGRTRTAPAGASEHLRFAICSCASYGHGHFHVYEEIGGRADLDAVVHLGDYIYEFADGTYGNRRTVDPLHDLLSLDDYRRRHRQCKTDRGLQFAHRQHPFIVTWDDHEVANDGWIGGAANHDEAMQGPWSERQAAGIQAYFEWLPVREGPEGRIYRELAYGDLVDVIVLDTRYEGREEPINLNSHPDPLTAINDPERQLLGEDQEAWLFERLSASSARWILLAQQVMVGQSTIEPGEMGEPHRPLFADPWDGYDSARRRLFGHLRDNDIDNLVVLTGDVHSSFANELNEDPLGDDYDPMTGAGSVAVEFVTPSVSSPGLAYDEGTLAILQSRNPHWRWVEVLYRGYVTVDVKAERVQGDWWLFGSGQLVSPDFSGSIYGSSWAVEHGTKRLTQVDEAAAEKPDPPALAP